MPPHVAANSFDPVDDYRTLQAMLAVLPHGIVVQGDDGQIILANPAAEIILGLPLDQMTGRTSVDHRWRSIHPDGSPYPGDTHPAMITLADGHSIDDAVMGVHRPDGGLVWLSVSTRAMALPDGSRGVTSSFVDVTARTEHAMTLHEANERFEVMFQTNPGGSAIVDLDRTPGRLLQANWALLELSGLSDDDVQSSWITDLFEVASQVRVRSALDELIEGMTDRVHVEAELHNDRWVDVTFASVIDATGRPSYAVLQFTDITERRDRESELVHQNSHDALTGLANRHGLTGRLAEIIADEGARQRVAVLFCDLDGFKQVNDHLGHAAGDVVLVTIADRLRTAVRHGDLVARHGGDEFVILLDRLVDDNQLEVVGRRIVDAVRAPIFIGNDEVQIGISIGAVRPRSGDTVDVLHRADAAMYLAKTAGKGQLLLVA